MLSEEMKEAVEKLVQEHMSKYCERTNATIARLTEENKKLVHEMNVGLDNRIKNVISGMPRNFWTKIFEMDQQETEEADKSQAGSSFEDSWSREKDEPFQTALDFNDTRLQKKNEDSLEAMIQQENERQCKIVLEMNKETKDSSNQPMSLDTRILFDQNSEGKDDPKEIVRPKHDSNQPMSLDTRILLDQTSVVKDDQKEIVDPKNDSTQPMSLDTRILLDQTSEVKGDQKEIVEPKNDSTQPMSLDTRILLDQTTGSVVKDDQKEIVDPKNYSTQPTEERPMPGECAGAKGNIDLQASGIEREKEKSSKRQEGSKTSKLKMAFLPFKKKGNTNH